MLRRRMTASLAIGGLFLGLTTTALRAQEPLVGEVIASSPQVEPVHYAESDIALDASPAAEYVFTDAETEALPVWHDVHRGGWFVDGWLTQGYTVNPDNPASNSNRPLGFNDRADEYQMNQLYLTFGKAIAEDCCNWDFGFQVDLLYGTDYFFTQSRGLELRRDGSRRWNGDGPRDGGEAARYGLAMPQLYAEAFIPVGSGLKAKFGHFYSLLGYESVRSPDNFFYSHTHSYVYGEPKTHTGFLLSYDLTTCLTFEAGMTNGWDNFETINGSHGYLMGVRWSNDIASLAFAMHTGAEDPDADFNRFVYSLVYTRQLADRWHYTFQHDYGVEEDLFLNDAFESEDATYYSFAQYLYYHLTPKTDVGIRLEWFRDEDNSRVQQVPVQNLYSGSNYYNLTLGANWRPRHNILVRPEARYDWSDLNPAGTTGVFNDFEDDRMWTFAVDVVWQF